MTITLITPTVIPYLVGPDNADRLADARKIDPVLNGSGDNGTLPGNPLLTGTPTLADFLKAHTAHQVEYLKTQPNDLLTIGGLSFMASTDGVSVINIDQLQIGAISQLPLADQLKLTNLPTTVTGGGKGAWIAVADLLGYVPNSQTILDRANAGQGATSLSDFARNSLIGAVTAAKTKIDKAEHAMPTADKALFKDQLDNMIKALNAGGIFNKDEVGKAIEAIQTRFTRANLFYEGSQASSQLRYTGDPAGTNHTGTTINYFDKATLDKGYAAFIAEERSMRNADNRMMRLVELSAAGVPTIDLPALIVQIQTLYEDKAKSRANANTEELSQQNALLRSYAAFEAQIVQAKSTFNPEKPQDGSAAISQGPGGSTEMFFKGEANGVHNHPNPWGSVLHPIEILAGLKERPQTTLGQQLKSPAVDALLQKVQATVTTLNQNNQIRQNSISTDNSQANRHFELVSNSLRRVFDLMQTIGRSTA